MGRHSLLLEELSGSCGTPLGETPGGERPQEACTWFPQASPHAPLFLLLTLLSLLSLRSHAYDHTSVLGPESPSSASPYLGVLLECPNTGSQGRPPDEVAFDEDLKEQ